MQNEFDPTMKLSFIIPAYNEELYIGECLDSILKNAAGYFYEIIVVDNHSTDGTSEVASSRAGIRVVYESKQGITFARQRGLIEATGDVLAFVDADTRLPSIWIKTVLLAFELDAKLVCLSGPYRYFDGPKIKRWFLDFISWSTLLIGYRLLGYMLNGGNYVVKKQALIDSGGYDLTIDFFGEDTDIGRRLHRRGKTVLKLIYLFSRLRAASTAKAYSKQIWSIC